MPTLPQCQRRQSKPIEDEALLLGIVPRDHPLYFELRNVSKSYEKTHRVARQRYTTGANNHDTRPKRVGVDFLEMRSRVSHFVEVFRLCLRNGWLGDHPTKDQWQPRRRPGGAEALKDFNQRRRIFGWLRPQGPAARKLNFIWDGALPKGWTLLKDKRAKAKANISDAAKTRSRKKRQKGKGGKGAKIPTAADSSNDPFELPPPSEDTPF